MYVCICNALTDRQVNEVIVAGERDALAVHPSLGCTTRCGKCLTTIADMMAATQNTQTSEHALAAE
ncbi:MAG: (2Fe-2S)-binding protein [Minwuia sp.]|nr:(2Fe-2S)-binding protein [Minwuia sp.]